MSTGMFLRKITGKYYDMRSKIIVLSTDCETLHAVLDGFGFA